MVRRAFLGAVEAVLEAVDSEAPFMVGYFHQSVVWDQLYESSPIGHECSLIGIDI